MAINMHKLHLVQRYVMYGLRTVRSGGKRKVATPTGMCEGKDPECVNRAEGLFADEADALGYADDLRTLHAAPERRDLAFRLNVGADLLEPALRRVELSNFLEARVRPTRSARGRA